VSSEPVKTVVHMLRHGEVYNPDQVLYGRLPGYQLSELGHQMAKAAAEVLAAHDITYLVASPLERAQHRDQRRIGQLVVAELNAGAAEDASVETLDGVDELAEQPRLADP